LSDEDAMRLSPRFAAVAIVSPSQRPGRTISTASLPAPASRAGAAA
jgi:hypothetical protein